MADNSQLEKELEDFDDFTGHLKILLSNLVELSDSTNVSNLSIEELGKLANKCKFTISKYQYEISKRYPDIPLIIKNDELTQKIKKIETHTSKVKSHIDMLSNYINENIEK
ncbi:MAG: hypothetical protein MHMPM18_002582 [Marteilia pararefringens]